MNGAQFQRFDLGQCKRGDVWSLNAACCAALGERSRSEDHRDATRLLALVTPGGDDAANALGRLLAVKNDAEYGLTNVSRAAREQALRQARKLVEFAEAHLRR